MRDGSRCPSGNDELISAVDVDGFAVVPEVLSKEERERWIKRLGPVDGAGRRGLLAMPEVAALAGSEPLMELVRSHLPDEPRAVRAIYFDKSAEANWLVPWHQDLTLAVRARVEVAGYGPWSVKDGVPHVQPPVELLERMLTVRLHLDDADESNGALKVLPGSHRKGRLSAGQIQEIRREGEEETCIATAGDALLMRPLLLHASGKSSSERNRRVLHIEYAAFELPDGLEWHEGG